MTQHTPAPWTTGITGVNAPMVQTGVTRICDVQKTDDFCETALANARLIAAAPELLGAIESLLDHEGEAVVNGIGLVFDSPALEKAKEKARAAINKARGI